MRAMLCLLAKPNSVANANSIIVRTLCSAGIPQQLIADFAGGKYPVVSGENNDQLDWLLKELYPLIRAARLHNAGNRKHAVLTFKLWVDEGGCDCSLCMSDCDDDLLKRIHDVCGNDINVMKSLMMNIDECIAFAKFHTLRLDENDNFWSWVQEHSLIAKEYEKTFDGRVQYLC